MGRLAVFLNPRSGGRDAWSIQSQLRRAFDARRADAQITTLQAGADLGSRIQEGIEGAAVAVAAGGDGTVSAVASITAGTALPLGVIPLGTLNHFARDLQIPTDLEQAIDVVMSEHAVPVDVGEVNGRVFVNNASLGVYPSLVHAREAFQRSGHGRWVSLFLAVRSVVRTQHRLVARVEAGHASTMWRTPFVFVGNNEYDVTGLRIAGRTRVNTGRLVAYVAPRVHVRDLPMTLIREWLGRAWHRTAVASSAFHALCGGELFIDTTGPRQIEVALDGEVVSLTRPLHFRSRPGALTVRVPAR